MRVATVLRSRSRGRASTARSAALFIVLVGVAAWPSRDVRATASQVLSVALTALLEQCEFGAGGRAQIRPAAVQDVRRPGESVSSDAELVLTIEAPERQAVSSINLRRDAYLPLMIFVAAALSVPVSLKKRAATLALGLPVTFSAIVAAHYLTVCWLFAHLAPEVYPLGERGLAVLDALVGTLLMPPALRFFVPLLIAVNAAIVLSGRRATSRAACAASSPEVLEPVPARADQ